MVWPAKIRPSVQRVWPGWLERWQIGIYFVAVVAAAALAFGLSGAERLESAIKPALALMLFLTFLQVPLAELACALTRLRFLAVLLASNFLLLPLLVAFLLQFLPAEPMLKLGVLLVLLAPCIDYVVTFSRIGGADERLLLAATPILLLAQLLLLPLYLRFFLGPVAAALVQPGPFFDAFMWLIAAPWLLAALAQWWAKGGKAGVRVVAGLGWLPVPATALVLFVVVAAVAAQLEAAIGAVLRVLPIYLAFAAAAPLLGWLLARLAGLEVSASRAVAFSSATRNSLVVLPLALALPGAVPLLPAVIVAQTLVELLSSLVYMRWMPRLGVSQMAAQSSSQSQKIG